MADTNTASVAGIAKRVYDTYVETQQNLKTKALDEIARSLKNYSPGGEGYFGDIDDYGNESVGAINEEESFRTIDSEHYAQWKVIPKVLAAPIQFSGLVSKALEGGEESFANAVVDALDKARERLKKDENRQFFGSGNGVLGSPSATVSSLATTIPVTNAQYFRANQVIDIYTSTGGTSVVSHLRITDVDKTNNILTLGAAVGVALASSNVITKENILVNAPADGKEMMGLEGISDDGTLLTTFQNLATTQIWRGRRIDASASNLTSDLMQRLVDDIHVIGGETVDMLIMHPKQRRSYLNLVVPQKRYMDGDMDTGFDKLAFNGIELFLDEDCQTDHLFALKKSFVRKFELEKMGMGTHDGSDVFLRIANQDVFQAYWRHYSNIGTSKRNATGKLVNLATPLGAS